MPADDRPPSSLLQPWRRALSRGLVYIALAVALVALAIALQRERIDAHVSPALPPDFDEAVAAAVEQRELLGDRLAILNALALRGLLAAPDHFDALDAYSRLRAVQAGCVERMLLALADRNAIPPQAVDCLRAASETPAALGAEKVRAAVAAAGARPAPDPGPPRAQSEDQATPPPGPTAGLAAVIDLEARIADAALAREERLVQLRRGAQDRLTGLLESWRWPPAYLLTPPRLPGTLPTGGPGPAPGLRLELEDAAEDVRSILAAAVEPQDRHYAQAKSSWLDDLTANADNAPKLRTIMEGQSPARLADNLTESTASAFPGLRQALLALDGAVEGRIADLERQESP